MEAEYYDKVYRSSKEYRKAPENSIYFEVWKAILNLLTQGEPVYELGCGSGQLARFLMSKGIYYIWGCDYSQEAINLANKHSDKFMVADIFEIEIPMGTILCTEVFEHLQDDKKLIARIPVKSRLIFSVPDFMVESHVRCFKSEKEIREYYAGISIQSISKHQVGKHNIYLVDSLL